MQHVSRLRIFCQTKQTRSSATCVCMVLVQMSLAQWQAADRTYQLRLTHWQAIPPLTEHLQSKQTWHIDAWLSEDRYHVHVPGPKLCCCLHLQSAVQISGKNIWHMGTLHAPGIRLQVPDGQLAITQHDTRSGQFLTHIGAH